ncbi:MAG: TonB-dependent receptor [Gammaproteobacteria bacterium]|nr:TonB-dependent receptor [Gammaproteobacteria bacterium]
MKQFKRNPIASAVSAVVTGSMMMSVVAAPAEAQQATGALEEIVVTAQKREQNLQDVAISVQVLGNTQLEQLNLNNFADYIEFLPTVSYTSERPGVSLLYMRGISSGGDGVHSGSMPSVGVYVDEQPVTTINRVLDVHVYDIERIETLAGPQGTYFGASSQSGTMRIITNKPKMNEFEAGFDIAGSSVSEGGTGYTLEGFVNMPISDNAAIRLVGWHEEAPGYIDNVLTSITYQGVGITKDNSALVEEDFNDSTTTGMRALLKVDLNENWTVTPGLMVQNQDTNGVFTHDPEDLGDLQAGRFYDEFYDFSWYQASLTVEGRIGNMDLVYAGAYLDLDSDSLDDYNHYAQYLDNYYGYYGGCYHYDSNGFCTDPSQYITADEKFTKQSHEIRLQSNEDQRARWVVGAFMQRQEHNFDLRWEAPDLDTASSVIENGNVAWQTKQDRVDKDLAVFGEVNFDITDNLTLVGGYRWYEFVNSLSGFNGGLGRCLDANDQPQFPCYDFPNVDDVSKDTGNTVKIGVNYNLSDDKMVYATYSEGFRPGGVNRATVAGDLAPKYDPDSVDNIEMGWKTMWADGRLRFNGAIYHLEWDNFQFAFLDYAVSPLTIIRNIGKAETDGMEFDLVFAASDALTLSLSASYNDAQLQTDYLGGGTDVLAPVGQEMPYVPELQYTAIARYEFEGTRIPFYAQAAYAYTDATWSNLETDLRERQPSYSILNLATGIQGEQWSLDLFLDNATDERAQIVRYGGLYYDPYDDITQDSTILVNRPRTIGLRYGRRF